MDIVSIIFTLLGGLGLFLFGIKLMEDGLYQLSGNCFRQIIQVITKNRFSSLLTGLILTTLMQSSSATSAMVVRFINAGLTSLQHTLGFLLGANVGATTTGQIISFQLDTYSLPIFAIGVILYLFFQREKIKNLGLSLLGVGMLFYGMVVMKSAIIPLQASGIIEQWLVFCDASTTLSMLIAVCIATIVTIVIQSSGAAIGILIALALSGAFKDFVDVIPLILGCEIGTCITAGLACLRTNTAAKKSALAHLFFNVTGAAVILLTYPIWVWLMKIIATDMSQQIANMHTLSSIIKCVIFLPLLPLVLKMFNWMLPDKEVTTIDLINKYKTFSKSQNLDKSFLKTPSLTLMQTHKELGVMVQIIGKMARRVNNSLLGGKEEDILRVPKYEEITDNIKKDIHDYMTLLAQQKLTTRQSLEIRILLEGANEVERIADHIEKMCHFVRLTKERVMVLDENNKSHIAPIIQHMVDLTKLIEDKTNGSGSCTKITTLEKQIQKEIKAAKDYYNDCLRRGSWNLFSDLSFIDMLSILEKWCRHCRSFTIKYLKALQSLGAEIEVENPHEM